jgi:hypothetical protein
LRAIGPHEHGRESTEQLALGGFRRFEHRDPGRVDVMLDDSTHELEQDRRGDRIHLDAVARVETTTVIRAGLRRARRQLVLVDLLAANRHAFETDVRARSELAESAFEVPIDLDPGRVVVAEVEDDEVLPAGDGRP